MNLKNLQSFEEFSNLNESKTEIELTNNIKLKLLLNGLVIIDSKPEYPYYDDFPILTIRRRKGITKYNIYKRSTNLNKYELVFDYNDKDFTRAYFKKLNDVFDRIFDLNKQNKK